MTPENIAMSQEKSTISGNQEQNITLTPREQKIKALLETEGVTFEGIEQALLKEKINPPTLKELMRFLVGSDSSGNLH